MGVGDLMRKLDEIIFFLGVLNIILSWFHIINSIDVGFTLMVGGLILIKLDTIKSKQKEKDARN